MKIYSFFLISGPILDNLGIFLCFNHDAPTQGQCQARHASIHYLTFSSYLYPQCSDLDDQQDVCICDSAIDTEESESDVPEDSQDDCDVTEDSQDDSDVTEDSQDDGDVTDTEDSPLLCSCVVQRLFSVQRLLSLQRPLSVHVILMLNRVAQIYTRRVGYNECCNIVN